MHGDQGRTREALALADHNRVLQVQHRLLPVRCPAPSHSADSGVNPDVVMISRLIHCQL